MSSVARRARLRAGASGLVLAVALSFVAAEAGANAGGVNPGAGTCQCTQNGANVPCVTVGATCKYKNKAGTCKNKTLGIIGHTYCECEIPLPKKGESTKASASSDVPIVAACSGTYTFSIFATPEQKLIAFFPEELGYGEGVELTQFDGTFTVQVGPSAKPDTCSLKVLEGSGSAPSFQAGAIPSGPNFFTFGDPSRSSGEVDVLTNEFTVQAVGTITNDLVPDGIPVDGLYEGTVDLVDNTITFHSISLDTYNLGKRVPTLGGWALLLCATAVVALAALWLRRSAVSGVS